MSAPAPPRRRASAGTSTPKGPPERKPFELKSSGKRAQIMLIVFIFALSLFASRLVELQVLRGDDLATSALSQRLVSEDIPATRGTITDVNGRPLAVSVEVRDITADQTLVKDAAETASVLGPILDMEPAELQPLLEGDRRFIYIKKSTEPQVWRDIKSWQAGPENDPTVLQGIFSERRTVRDYPNKKLAANVVGFTNSEGRGAVGLESWLDTKLAGTAGSVNYERAAGGTEIPTSEVVKTEPIPGSDVRLTIDADLQWTAQEAITSQVKAQGADFGMVVALEVGTGRILAMATGPSFDPERPEKVKPEQWQNRPVSWVMEPGSTAKIMSIAAVLEEGRMNVRSPITVPNRLKRGDKEFKDSHDHPTLNLTLAGVFAESSNIGTILAAESIGGKRLYSYLRGFGVGQPSGVNFPGEQTGYIPKYSEWSDTTFPTVAFGQGMSMTALQIANMVATFGNDGVRVEPKLVDSYRNPDGTVQRPEPGKAVRVLSARTAKKTRELMQLVTREGGTAADLDIPGYVIGGKTGTAQRYDQTCGCYSGYTASFVGLAPADKPRVVVGAWVDNPGGSIYGGVVAGPVVEKVMAAALASLDVPPSGAKSAKIPLNAKQLRAENG